MRKRNYNFSKDCCARCGVCVNRGKRLAGRRVINHEWMRRAIMVHNQTSKRLNKYICGTCRTFLWNQYYTVYNFSEHLEKLEDLNDKNDKDSPVKITENRLDFDQIESKRCYMLTGLYINQLKDFVLSYGELKPPVKLSLLNCFGFYLMKLRLGISSNELGSLYNEPSIYQVKEIVKFCRDIMSDKFTPINLGVSYSFLNIYFFFHVI